jgi:hypothetical protein
MKSLTRHLLPSTSAIAMSPRTAQQFVCDRSVEARAPRGELAIRINTYLAEPRHAEETLLGSRAVECQRDVEGTNARGSLGKSRKQRRLFPRVQ